MNHGFQANIPAIRVTSISDGTEIISYTCSQLPDSSSNAGVKFDWVSSVSGVKGSYSDSNWAQCLGVYPGTPETSLIGNSNAQFLLMTSTLKVKLMMISFDQRTYIAYESESLSYINSFDATSSDVYGFVFKSNAAFFGTFKNYGGTALTRSAGFIEMSTY